MPIARSIELSVNQTVTRRATHAGAIEFRPRIVLNERGHSSFTVVSSREKLKLKKTEIQCDRQRVV